MAFLLLGFASFFLTHYSCASRGEINHLRLGVWAAEQDLWDEAIYRWQKALEKEPQSAILYNNLAVAYEKKGWWEKAKEAYETALKLAPENKYIHANYKSFQENLKFQKFPEKKEEKKQEKAR
ncbi:MAG: tetratricopeptide repeat protein [Candidatus Aminicenantes bacterium]|nr:tetratricopeptide repeat protein [Candidatus Aminicenantes bacterium]